jgi:hypothetical protein
MLTCMVSTRGRRAFGPASDTALIDPPRITSFVFCTRHVDGLDV